MECRSCGKNIPVFDRKCPDCGASSTPVLDGAASGCQLDRSCPDSGILSEDLLKQAPGVEQHGTAEVKFKWKTTKKGARRPSSLPGHDEGRFWEPIDQEIFQIAGFVFNSPHVQNNSAYRERATQVTLLYASDTDSVNAFATDMHHPTIPADPPVIVIMEGLVRACRVASIGLGWERRQADPDARRRLVGIVQALGRAIVKGEGALTAQSAQKVVNDLELGTVIADRYVHTWTRSFRDAMIMGIISHELGHIALSHTMGMPTSYGVSRNQEREADSFAASVINSSPFSDYMVTGMIFFWLILCWADTAAKDSDSTHPHAGERLLDFIRASREQASAIGFTEETIAEFLPENNR